MLSSKQVCFLMIALFSFSLISADVFVLNKKIDRPVKKHALVNITTSSKYYNLQPRKNSTSHRVVNGIKAKFSDFPFIASIVFDKELWCGASVLSDTVVLTAAHCCLDQSDDAPFNINYMVVSVGSSKWKQGIKFNVRRCIVHERYNGRKLINDIALVTVKGKITDTSKVKLVNLASQRLNEHAKPILATVIGWGRTNNSQGYVVEEATDDLLMAKIHSMPLQECRSYWDGILDSMICFRTPATSACNGDSGGPLVIRKNSKLVQVGLVSFGRTSCRSKYPHIYTRISSFYSWIKQKMSKVRKRKERNFVQALNHRI